MHQSGCTRKGEKMHEEQSASEKNPTNPPLNSSKPDSSKPGPTSESSKTPRRTPATRRARADSASASKDISLVLKGWDYESGTINVRKVAGLGRKPKLQRRLDL